MILNATLHDPVKTHLSLSEGIGCWLFVSSSGEKMSSASESSEGSDDPESDTSVMEKSDTSLLTGLYSCCPNSCFSFFRLRK